MRLVSVSPGGGPLVPPSLHPSRAKPRHPCPNPSPNPNPATSGSQQQSQTPVCVGWSCLGQLYVCKLLLPRAWSKGEAAVVELGVGKNEASVLGLLQHPASIPACHSIPLSIPVPQAAPQPPDARKGKRRWLRGNSAAASAPFGHRNLLALRRDFGADNSTPRSM